MATPVDELAQQPQAPTPRRSRSLQLAGTLVAGLIVIALATLLLSRISTANTQAHNVPAGAKGISLVGKVAPDVAITVWQGGAVGGQTSLASLRGHAVVLNFWEASCDPCKAEAPLLEQAARAYQAQGVDFIGVALYTSQADGQAFLKQQRLTYLAGVVTTNQTVVDYSLIGVPDTYFISKSGVIVDQNVGQIGQSELTAGIQRALKG